MIFLTARADVRGGPGEAIAFPAWTDGSLLAKYGDIPTLICGPGDLALAHSPEESIELSEVHAAARMYLKTALNFLR